MIANDDIVMKEKDFVKLISFTDYKKNEARIYPFRFLAFFALLNCVIYLITAEYITAIVLIIMAIIAKIVHYRYSKSLDHYLESNKKNFEEMKYKKIVEAEIESMTESNE